MGILRMLTAACVVVIASGCGGAHDVATSTKSLEPVATSASSSRVQPHDGLILFARHFRNPDQGSVPAAAWTPRAALYSVRPDGRDVRRLTPVSGLINEIAVSPGGNVIAYDAETYAYGKDPHVTGDYVHVMNADGTNNRTTYSCPSSSCSSLQWSPTGGRLLVNGDAVLEPDGHVRKLCAGGCGRGHPLSAASWSPDGRHLVFEDSVTVRRPGGASTVSAIGTADADGRHVRLLTNWQCRAASTSACTYDSSPVWSPDGQHLAFVRLTPSFLRLDRSLGPNPTGPTGVYTVRPDGTGITRVSICGSECSVTSLHWAGDGSRLTFVGTPYLLRNDTTTSSVDVADTTSGSIDVVPVRTHTSQPDEEWIAPALTWAPSGQHLAVVAHRSGEPSTLDTIRLHRTTMGPLVPIREGAYPPLAWLPELG